MLRKQSKELRMGLISLRKWIRSFSNRRRSDYCSGFVTDICDQIAIWFDNWQRQDRGKYTRSHMLTSFADC